MDLQTKTKMGVVFATLLCGVPAMAAPITYTFTTGAFGASSGSSATPNALALISPDAYVSGSFIYDPDSPFFTSATLGTSGSIGAGYQAIHDMEGSLHMGESGSSYTFNSAISLAFVFNDAVLQIPNSPLNDLLSLAVIAPTNGFTLGNLPLYTVAFSWIGQPNFLDSNALPNSLPAFVGRLNLSLGTVDANGRASDRVFFDSLTVTPVPLPGAAMLFMSGVFGLVTAGRFRKRGNVTA